MDQLAYLEKTCNDISEANLATKMALGSRFYCSLYWNFLPIDFVNNKLASILARDLIVFSGFLASIFEVLLYSYSVTHSCNRSSFSRFFNQ